MANLTMKQRVFITEYLKDFNATQAAIRAGYSEHTASAIGCENLQKHYIKKVVDTVNDFNNVLYEIGNEMHTGSVEWHYHIIDFIHQYEKSKAKAEKRWNIVSLSVIFSGVGHQDAQCEREAPEATPTTQSARPDARRRRGGGVADRSSRCRRATT